MNYSQRLHKVIPAGCHTYSRGDDQFPFNAPQALVSGSGAYVYGGDGKEYLDYGMGLRAVVCGYNEKAITNAALEGMLAGNCLTRPSVIELAAAELACSLLDLDMVKFTKNGSTATTSAVKLARAVTGRSAIACGNQPFFSYDDWFIGTTKRSLGTSGHSAVKFRDANDLDLLARQVKIACAILEPKDYDLQAMRDVCDRHGIILIFDEMITGFRYDWPSVSQVSGVKPDLACFGKGMANGFSVACIGGKREIMEIGARPDFFFASSTHGAEMSGLAAFMATVKFMEEHNVSKHLRDYLVELEKWLPAYVFPRFFRNDDALPVTHINGYEIEKTIFMQEMCRNGVLMPYISPSYRHGEHELALTKQAIEKSLDAIGNGVKLEGKKVKGVFS